LKSSRKHGNYKKDFGCRNHHIDIFDILSIIFDTIYELQGKEETYTLQPGEIKGFYYNADKGDLFKIDFTVTGTPKVMMIDSINYNKISLYERYEYSDLQSAKELPIILETPHNGQWYFVAFNDTDKLAIVWLKVQRKF